MPACVCVCVCRGRESNWQCQSDLCPTQISGLIDGLEIGLKGPVPPSHLLVHWHRGRAPLAGIIVIILLPCSAGTEVGGWSGPG